MIRKIAAFLLLLLQTVNSYSQSVTTDSLKFVLSNTKDETLKCQILYNLIESDYDPAVWSKYNDQLGEISLMNYKKATKHDLRNYYLSYYGMFISNLGYLYNIKGNLALAQRFYNQALFFQKYLKDDNSIAVTLTNLGYVYRSQGNVKKAIDAYYEALTLFEKVHDKKNIASLYNNIGFVHSLQGEYEKALDSYTAAIEINKELGDKSSLANTYNNMAKLYYTNTIIQEKSDTLLTREKNLITGIEYVKKAIAIQREINDFEKLSGVLNALGGVYESYGNPDCKESKQICEQKSTALALSLYEEALAIRVKIGDQKGLSQSYYTLAAFYRDKGDLSKALILAEKAIKIGNDLGIPELIRDASELLRLIYQSQKKHDKALEMFALHIKMRDSLNNESTRKVNLKKQFEHDYERQLSKDSIANMNKTREEQLRHEQAINKQRTYTYGGFVGLALMLIVALISFKAFKNKQKANIIITEQKQLAESQKQIIEQKQKEILDSIAYAKRLQEAILPPQELVNKHLPQNFILYKPKDIVAGDFYWFEHIDGASYFAAADSTGHGVPGALVSVVCSNALNRAVNEFRLRLPGEILDKTRELVLETFARSDKEVKDGMDISLVKISELPAQKSMTGRLVIPKGQSLNDVLENQRKHKIDWAGANNPLWYYQNGSIHEITAHKQPIGKTEKPMPFPTHTLELNKGDMLYLFTDGYADQFGGPKGKKFKYKQLEELLLSNTTESMDLQKQKLNQAFDNWKGGLEQIDDVCIIGIKI